MKPAQLLPCSLVLALAGLAGSAFGQAQPGSDGEPAAAAPAPPPAPAPPQAAQPPPADLPPPPPPRGAPPAPQGKLVISAPPVPPAMQRAGYHVHDGFYLRIAAGIGAGHFDISTDSSLANDFSVGGGGLGLNLWLGGTPWRGIALGGMAMLQNINESNTQVAGRSTHETMHSRMVYLGPFIDAFPDPLRGLHVGGSLGLASFTAEASGDVLATADKVKDYDAGGFGASAWVGYMGFVGPEWSLGGLLQLTALATSKTENEIKRNASGYALTLSFSALFH